MFSSLESRHYYNNIAVRLVHRTHIHIYTNTLARWPSRGFLSTSGHPRVPTSRPIVRETCIIYVYVCVSMKPKIHGRNWLPRAVQMSNLLQQFLLHRHLLLNNIFFLFSILSLFDTMPTTQAATAVSSVYCVYTDVRSYRQADDNGRRPKKIRLSASPAEYHVR